MGIGFLNHYWSDIEYHTGPIRIKQTDRQGLYDRDAGDCP